MRHLPSIPHLRIEMWGTRFDLGGPPGLFATHGDSGVIWGTDSLVLGLEGPAPADQISAYCGWSLFAEGLEGEIGRAKLPNVFLLFVECVEMHLFVADELFKDFFGCGVEILGALTSPLVVIAGAVLLHLGCLGKNLDRVREGSTANPATISTSPFRNRIRSASFSMCPISVMAVRLKSVANGSNP